MINCADQVIHATAALPGGFVVTENSIMALLLVVELSPEMAAATTPLTKVIHALIGGVGSGLVGLYMTKGFLHKGDVVGKG